MISAINYKAIPFFDRVPPRAMFPVRKACERLTSGAVPTGVFDSLVGDLKDLGVSPPSHEEFKTWFEDVKLGRFTSFDYGGIKPYEPVAKGVIERHVMDCMVHDPETREAFRPVYEMAMDTRTRGIDLMERPVTSADADPAALAFEIIEKRVALVDAMIAAGYSPESCDIEDSIVAEAIESWLKASAMRSVEGITATALALQMLDDLDDAGNEKLLGVLANCMQAELVVAITAMQAEGGAA